GCGRSLRRPPLHGNEIDHPQHERENQSGKCRNGAITLWRGLGRDGRQRVHIRQSARIQDEKNSIHVAKTLVVLVNKLTLGAPFHLILLEWVWWIRACG